jgi:hypothetical protein
MRLPRDFDTAREDPLLVRGLHLTQSPEGIGRIADANGGKPIANLACELVRLAERPAEGGHRLQQQRDPGAFTRHRVEEGTVLGESFGQAVAKVMRTPRQHRREERLELRCVIDDVDPAVRPCFVD